MDYESMIQALKLLEGHEVVLFISGGADEVTGADRAEAASRVQAKGILRQYDYGGWAQGFAIGDAARVLLYEGDFIRASQSEWDGVDVSVNIRLTDVTLVIGKSGPIETDEFDLFP